MPRERQEAYYIGGTTAKILKAVPPEQAAWLIQALMRWCLDGEEPQDVPPECIGSWTAIVDESERIHAAREQQREAGRKGGEAKRTPSEPEANASEPEANASEPEANASEPEANGKRKGTKKEKEIKREIKTDTETETENARGSLRSSDSDSDSDSGKIPSGISAPSRIRDAELRAAKGEPPAKQDFYDLPDLALVDAALRLCREEGSRIMRGRLGKARRTLGDDEFRSILATFAAEIEAGEDPANRGATLNAKLSAAEACLGLARR